MTEQELREIEARAAGATAGPWSHQPSGANEAIVMPSHDRMGRVTGIQVCVWDAGGMGNHVAAAVTRGRCTTEKEALAEMERSNKDAAFIAHARTDVPALIAEVRRLRGELAAAIRRRADA